MMLLAFKLCSTRTIWRLYFALFLPYYTLPCNLPYYHVLLSQKCWPSVAMNLVNGKVASIQIIFNLCQGLLYVSNTKIHYSSKLLLSAYKRCTNLENPCCLYQILSYPMRINGTILISQWEALSWSLHTIKVVSRCSGTKPRLAAFLNDCLHTKFNAIPPCTIVFVDYSQYSPFGHTGLHSF